MEKKFPFEGPRFAIGDRVRVKRKYFSRFVNGGLPGFKPGKVYVIASVRDRKVFGDPKAKPPSDNHMEQLVGVKAPLGHVPDFVHEFEAFYFEKV